MPHLDEGTVHSWLDGALSAADAARVEAHVKDCAQCQAAVAEARGFIAASSRILTALDNAPRGVIPAAASKKRIDPIVWRIAASVLVVALGSVLVIREQRGGAKPRAMTASRENAPVVIDSTASRSVPAVTPSVVLANPKTSAPEPSTQGRRSVSTAPASSPAQVVAAPSVASVPTVAGRANAGVRRDQRKAAAAPVAAQPAPNLRFEAAGRVAGVVANDAVVADEQPPKSVGHPRALGEKLTLYEVVPGDTVMLAEQVKTDLQSVVVTGAGVVTQQRPMAATAAPEAKHSARLAPSRDTQPSAPPQVVLPPPPAAAVSFAQTPDGIGTLSWKDPASGSLMRLSGRHNRAELEEIRRRIERARAAAADSTKRTP